MHAITYWVIRYVPDVARGEFHNVGVVCGSSNGDWAAAFDWQYLHKKTPRDVLEWAEWFNDQVRQGEALMPDHEFTRGWVEGIRQRQANSVQVGPPLPVVSDNARDAAATLYRQIVQHKFARRTHRTTRRQLRSEVRSLLSYTLMEGEHYFERPEVRLGQMHGDFDFVQVNEALPVIRNVWAFDVAGLDDLERGIQAWNYGITRLRDDGAVLRTKDRALELPSNSVVTAIIDPPLHDSRRRTEIFEATLEAWERERVDVLTVSQFEERFAYGGTGLG
ncbi:DUF3037 domain-containing protein [Chryseoglobus sp. 28M-23]|uniref:DUF3037 domain-containing protein n=1 Tax=Chryseoglobus sp. 28M-23 TaxID=2772253 RepID=UPI001745F5E7|nr:DUF3037 domain-containing protein [Chryseoglobus sp. 28M-23]QOD92988.1 DUF3037 domain-containing protein [Chryseoglobus sp. 28M-23]